MQPLSINFPNYEEYVFSNGRIELVDRNMDNVSLPFISGIINVVNSEESAGKPAMRSSLALMFEYELLKIKLDINPNQREMAIFNFIFNYGCFK